MSRGLGDGELVGVSTEHEACYKFGDMLLCSGAGLLSVLLGGSMEGVDAFGQML